MKISRRKFCAFLSSSVIGTIGCLESQNSNNLSKVISVIDGDTIDVILPSGSKDRVRLLGVDTPELSDKQFDDWNNISNSIQGEKWLNKWAKKSKEYAESKLLNKSVRLEYDSISEKRGSYDRLLAYIYTNNTDVSFNLKLIKNGYARMYDSEFEKRKVFQDMENKSIKNSRGIWGYKSRENSEKVQIIKINENAKGNDYNNLNDEYIILKNNRDRPINMSEWQISDKIKKRYIFPNNYNIQPNDTVTIHTGSGKDTNNDLYINSSVPIWNNSGDTVIVMNQNQEQILKYSY